MEALRTLSIRCLIFSITIALLLQNTSNHYYWQTLASQSENGLVSLTTGCDQLFLTNDNLSSYCQCREFELLPSGNPNKLNNILQQSTAAQISELSCSPENLSQMLADLASFAYALNNSQQLTLQVDYLNINTNLTKQKSAIIIDHYKRNQLIIDHISLQLTSFAEAQEKDSRPQDLGSDFGQNSNYYTLEEQMIDLGRLINGTHLQFLSIFLDNSGFQGKKMKPEENHVIKLNRLLDHFSGLERLELNLGPKASVLFANESRKEIAKVKWLNLASNNLVQLESFLFTQKLEVLNLEGCNLEKFHLLDLFKFAEQEQERLEPSPKKEPLYFGLANLNLANNKLVSLERDFFSKSSPNQQHQQQQRKFACCSEKSSPKDQSGCLVLPALTLLDLSRNKIMKLSPKEGQYLLCAMPNLIQLLLQQNKIKHINLNSLLSNQIPYLLGSIYDISGKFVQQNQVIHSQLEYIDLSQNILSELIGFQGDIINSSSAPQIHYINLSQNQLKRAISLLDSKLSNRILFEESFEDLNDENFLNNYHKLNADFLLDYVGDNPSTICDFLWPLVSHNNDEVLNEVILTNNRIEKLELKDFSSQKCNNVHILRLAKNHISSISADSFLTLINLDELDLSYNLLKNLNETTFSRTKELRNLDLSHNKLKHLDRNIFSNLFKLEFVRLNGNELKSITNDLFVQNQRLISIDLANNKLSYLDSAPFARLQNLDTLILTGNQLKRFSYHLFEPNMIQLNQTNKNEMIPKSKKKKVITKKQEENKSKASMKAMRHNRRQTTSEGSNSLFLASNQIESIKFDNCTRFTGNIQFLTLRDNSLKELTQSTFNCLPSLQRLDLASNRLSSIASETFIKMVQLNYIDLSHNQLNYLGTKCFRNVPNYISFASNQLYDLKLLDLFETKLTSIDFLDLSENLNLKLETNQLVKFLFELKPSELNISRIESIKSISGRREEIEFNETDQLPMNSIIMHSIQQRVDENFLIFLSKPQILVEKLDLSFTDMPLNKNNKLESMLLNRFQNNLMELSFAGNYYGINQLNRLLTNLTNSIALVNLNISLNRFESWPFDSIAANRLSNLRKLDLSSNRIRHLMVKDFDIEGYNFDQLELLDLSSNSLISLTESGSNYSLYKSMPSLKYLDLSRNRLSWIPVGFFDNLSSLRKLNLENNQLEFVPSFELNFALHLSFNQKLQLTADSNEVIKRPRESLITDEDLIILDDGISDKIKCFSIDYYEDIYSQRVNADEVNFEMRSNECNNLIANTFPIRLNSISSDANFQLDEKIVSTNGGQAMISLSLQSNGINSMKSRNIYNEIIALDLSDNKIQDPANICDKMETLMTLNLSNNLIRFMPSQLFTKCKHMTYLDMSFNRINSINISTQVFDSKVMILKLDHNMLTSLNPLSFAFLKSLRLLDLRNNHLKSVKLLGQKVNSLTILTSNETQLEEEIKHELLISDTSVRIGLDSRQNHTQLSIKQNSTQGTTQIQNTVLSGRHYEVKFCTLQATSLAEICLRVDEGDKCFLLKPPKILPCFTNLQEIVSQTTSKNHSNQIIVNEPAKGSKLTLNPEDDDPIIRLIESLKRYWLKLKEYDLNDHLIQLSNVRGDSVLLEIDGKYQIYTLSVLKSAIIIGSVCIIILLIIVFALLTCNSAERDAKREAQLSQSPTSTSEITNVTSETSTSVSSSSVDKSSSSLQASNICSSTSSSSKANNDTQPPTIMERRIFHQLDPSQLHQSLTPSSSLAPSSVETAETLQAIDSIQSASFANQVTNSVDQYQAEDSHITQQQQQQQQQVATVMRMIKSNSANFGAKSNLGGSGFSNYSTLKANPLRMTPQFYQNDHYNPRLGSFFVPAQHLEGSSRNEQDPTTLSLLSINSALSNSISRATSQQVSPTPEQTNNLCQYHHRLAQRDHLNETEIILEQEEDQFYNAGDILLVNQFPEPPPPPPPPASRAIEILENPMTFIQNENNFYQQ